MKIFKSFIILFFLFNLNLIANEELLKTVDNENKINNVVKDTESIDTKEYVHKLEDIDTDE